MLKGLKPALIIASSFLSFIVYSQKGDLIVKWNATRLINPFNSTIQTGVEYFVDENMSLEVEFGIKSPLFKNTSYYNKGIFITHGQIRFYYKNDFFAGIDLSYIHEKDYSEFRCMYNKSKKYYAEYDSSTLVKNAGVVTIFYGYQLKVGKIRFDFAVGTGLRVVNNNPDYTRKKIIDDCFFVQYNWHNDRNSGTFIGFQILAGIKIGYVLRGE